MEVNLFLFQCLMTYISVPTMIEVAPTMVYIFVHCARVLANLCFSCNKETDNEAPISAETSRR